jgi:N-acetylmannosamine-6-phosphate 2-epimerase/N-acetylmannosamine kinase
MNRSDFFKLLSGSPLVPSIYAAPGTPLDDPTSAAKTAESHVLGGSKILRVEGAANISAVRAATGATIIGLAKRGDGADGGVYITPAMPEVQAALNAGSGAIALDGTTRTRPDGANLADLIAAIHAGGALAMADIDSVDSAKASVAAGADLVATTLAGYTGTAPTKGPDLELVRTLAANLNIPILAEGRFTQRWEVEAALKAGAAGVVAGAALNDPILQTRALSPRFKTEGRGKVGAIDIGGTWMRFGTFTGDWKLIEFEKAPNPHDRHKLIDWLAAQAKASGVERIGVSTAGIVDPATGTVWKAKEYLIPDHVGVVFDEASLGVPTIAWGDGHATAWAHACLPQFAGRRVATLAIGTGVGCGFVQEDKIWCGPRGEYPRVNDQPTPGGKSYEDLLGGIHLTKSPTEEQEQQALVALQGAVELLNALYFPQDIVVGGGVGASDWMAPHISACGAVPTPLGADAGLYGAAALALFM